MARLVELPTFTDGRGNLTVIDGALPFEIRRVFYIYGVDDSSRGGHRHRRTRQAAVALRGGCVVRVHDGTREETFALDHPARCLVLEPEDWHRMSDFSPGTILMVLASERFDPADYVFEPYR